MNRVSPLIYLIGSMASTGLANTPIICTSLELLIINAPSPQSCGQHLAPYLREAGGRILNPDALGECEFCPIAKTNDVLASFRTLYGQRCAV
jgi:ATP-binding cassette, subfamily G (WHITE), member 2, PDR